MGGLTPEKFKDVDASVRTPTEKINVSLTRVN